MGRENEKTKFTLNLLVRGNVPATALFEIPLRAVCNELSTHTHIAVFRFDCMNGVEWLFFTNIFILS